MPETTDAGGVMRAEQPSPEPESSRYWKATSGFSYMEMIRSREGQGSRAYGQQERFLTALLEAEQRRLGRPLEVLEFGCGFGRHAAYLANLEGVRYHGYDFSEAMMAPLRENPPPGLRGAEGRLFFGDDVLKSVGGRQFDIVFTVSVLIHNPTERVPGLLQTLGRLVRPDGLVCLVENQLVPVGVWENGWHQGCWLHAYADAVGEGWDLHHGPGFVDTHDIYALKRNGGSGRRFFELVGPEQPRDESRPLTLEQLKMRALPKLQTWAGQVVHALKQAASSADVQVTELTERLQVEAERYERRHRLAAVADELAALRDEDARARARRPEGKGEKPAALPAPLLYDDPHDTTWAHGDPALSRVVHVFHQEWHGIRAAAGYAPGHKLAIPAEKVLDARHLRRAVELCANALARTVVVHSFSPNMRAFVLALRKVLGRRVRVLAVWHGSTAQFHFTDEYETFASLLDMAERGVIDRVACVKPDMHLLSRHIFPRTLLNFSPRVALLDRPAHASTGAAFIPTPNDWRKNFYTNLQACMAVPQLREVYVTTSYAERAPLKLSKPVHLVKRPGREEVFALMRKVDLVLNASLSECQPMTALEALALGVPCITGALGLGELDAHPYQQLAQVVRVDSVGAVRDAAERMLELQRREPERLRAMMRDYEEKLCAEALRLYEEFAES